MDRVKRLADIKGDRAFDAYAALIPPITAMTNDPEAVEFFTSGGKQTRMERTAAILGIASRNREAFKEIEAVKRGEPAEDMSMDDIFAACSELMNDTLFLCFFVLAHRDTARNTSPSVPDPTQAPAD